MRAVQETPRRNVASRTSPTNLGLALLAALCWNLAHANEISHLALSEGPAGTRAELQLKDGAEQRATLVRFIMEPQNVEKYKFLYKEDERKNRTWTVRDDVSITMGDWPPARNMASYSLMFTSLIDFVPFRRVACFSDFLKPSETRSWAE